MSSIITGLTGVKTIKRRLSTNENKYLLDRKCNASNSQVQINHLQVDKEIERFKKDLEVERKKLYELTRLSYEYKRTVNKEVTVKNQPVPVTNVVTQPKSNSEVDVKESLEIRKHVVFEDTPIEVFGYKPLSISTNKRTCVNDQSPFCPHRKPVEKSTPKENKPIKMQQLSHKNRNKDFTLKLDEGFFFGTHSKQPNKDLATKTIDKWKSFVFNKKTDRRNTDERLFRIKHRKYLLKKYLNKWLDHYRNSIMIKEESIRQRMRTEKMNLFFEKLEERKRDLDEIRTPSTHVVKKPTNKESLSRNKIIYNDRGSVFKNRLNAQKAIIQEQKEKLKERDKLIQQLQEKKVQENLKMFTENVKSTLLDTVNNFDIKLKPQIRQLANKANIYMDNSLKVTECDFVKRMNERAKERKEKWEMIRLKKQLLEEEKERKQKEEEERKREEEEQMKRNRIRAEKERIRLQKEIQLKVLLEIEETKIKMKNAHEYYKTQLMRKSIYAFKRNVSNRRKLEEKCKAHFNKLLMRLYFRRWKITAHYSLQRDIATANAFYTFNLIQWCWSNWILFYSEVVQKRQVAEDFYDAKLQEHAFVMWKDYVNKQHILYDRNLAQANCYYNRKLKRKYFTCWKKLPKAMYNIREGEKRIRAWRDKILEIIPDFKPELVNNEDDTELP